MRSRVGLRGKLISAMLLVGAVPLVVGMGMALVQGTQELHQMAGVNFESLASEAARTMDLVFSDELTRTSRIARAPLVVETLEAQYSRLRKREEAALSIAEEEARLQWEAGNTKLFESVMDSPVADFLTQQVARPEGETGEIIPASARAATRALFITDVRGNVIASTTQHIPYTARDTDWWRTAYDNGVGQPHIGNVSFDSQLGVYAFHVSLPIMDRIRYRAIGVLHRVFDAREYLAPSLFPIRFGKTGHVMLLDSQGTVMACPILPTGSRLADASLIGLVTTPQPGWVKADSDGHGGQGISVIGFSALPGTSHVTRASTGTTWHTFVWQAAEELSAPTHHFLGWLAGFSLVAMGLLGILGYVASGRIVRPIRHLQQAASLIGKGELTEPIAVKTGDELEQLADEMTRMNAQLERAFSGLTNTVEQKTQEVHTLQVVNQQILQSVPNPIILLDRDGHVEYLNRAAQNAFGVAPEVEGPRSLKDLLHVEAPVSQQLQVELDEWQQREDTTSRPVQTLQDESRDPLAPALPGDAVRRPELRLGDRLYEYQWFRIGTVSGEPSRLGLVFRDITDERRLQEKVIQAEKFSGLSLLASGLKHELNNPLFGVMGLGEVIAEESNPQLIKELAKDVVAQAKRMADVIQELTGQALRESDDQQAVIDCNELVEEVLARLRATDAGAGVQIRTELGRLPKIRIRTNELRQVLVNVLTNAVQAIGGNGVLEVRTEAANGLISMRIQDSGCGIPSAYLTKVFDAFFTTKAQGEGRGLGLTIARRIIESLGGQIEIGSREGHGSTVSITLPVMQPSECRRVS
ncbi:MAG TPA: ATP-binding protein [Nitrospiraceae bacterium]|nr:ATP-binding protein [Nitrospiraceae bacterium]